MHFGAATWRELLVELTVVLQKGRESLRQVLRELDAVAVDVEAGVFAGRSAQIDAALERADEREGAASAGGATS